MKKNLLINILFILLGNIVLSQTIEEQFQAILDSAYQANPSSVGIAIHVEAPDQNISWNSAVGHSDKEQSAISVQQPALIASNTKTFVAVSVLKLIEMDKIQLDQAIQLLLPRKTWKKMIRNGYDPSKITIKHLLSHTSGIEDYVNDDYFDFVNENRSHKWTRNKQIKLAMKAEQPLAIAGVEYKYADINYVLLTEIIESITKKPFYQAIRSLIDYKKHHLNATWFINLEETPEQVAPLVHQYWTKYNWDSYDLNPSWDLYGGGGLVSTTKDLALFFQALFEGQIIKNADLLEAMHTYVLPKEQSIYGLGIKIIVLEGLPVYYHGGFWGTDVVYIPELNASIAAFTLQKEERIINAMISKKIINILKKNY